MGHGETLRRRYGEAVDRVKSMDHDLAMELDSIVGERPAEAEDRLEPSFERELLRRATEALADVNRANPERDNEDLIHAGARLRVMIAMLELELGVPA